MNANAVVSDLVDGLIIASFLVAVAIVVGWTLWCHLFRLWTRRK